MKVNKKNKNYKHNKKRQINFKRKLMNKVMK